MTSQKKLLILDKNYPISNILNTGQDFDLETEFVMMVSPCVYKILEQETNDGIQGLTYLEILTMATAPNVLEYNSPIKVAI